MGQKTANSAPCSPLDEAGRLPIRYAFDVRVGREQFPASPVGERQAAAAEQRRTALLAVEQLEDAVPRGAGSHRIRESRKSRPAVLPSAGAGSSPQLGMRTGPQPLDIAEEPVQPECGKHGGSARAISYSSCVQQPAGGGNCVGARAEKVDREFIQGDGPHLVVPYAGGGEPMGELCAAGIDSRSELLLVRHSCRLRVRAQPRRQPPRGRAPSHCPPHRALARARQRGADLADPAMPGAVLRGSRGRLCSGRPVLAEELGQETQTVRILRFEGGGRREDL